MSRRNPNTIKRNSSPYLKCVENGEIFYNERTWWMFLWQLASHQRSQTKRINSYRDSLKVFLLNDDKNGIIKSGSRKSVPESWQMERFWQRTWSCFHSFFWNQSKVVSFGRSLKIRWKSLFGCTVSTKRVSIEELLKGVWRMVQLLALVSHAFVKFLLVHR